jgi:hypothetical protein
MKTALSSRFPALVWTALCGILAFACSDDKPGVSKRPLLADKAWAVVRYELNGEDVTDEREDCELDDVTTFLADGTFVEAIGDIACDESEEDTHGTWAFKANETILSMQEAGSAAQDWKLVTLTAESLKISQYSAALKMEVVVEMAPL